jgi:hypothetical protein
MFGVVKANLNYLSQFDKKAYNSTYCNLCASISQSGRSALGRFFLVFDVATVDWLLEDETTPSLKPFKCNNCIKGGTIGKKKRLTNHLSLLAAISNYMIGVKLTDERQDTVRLNLKTRLITLFYNPLFKKAKRTLDGFALLSPLNDSVIDNQLNEDENCSNITEASFPTERGYIAMCKAIAKSKRVLSEQYASLLGQYLGRCVYLYDALIDMDKDEKKGEYNVLNNQSMPLLTRDEKKQACFKLCMAHIKPLKDELLAKILTMSKSTKARALNVITVMDVGFIRYAKTLGDSALLEGLMRFIGGPTPPPEGGGMLLYEML